MTALSETQRAMLALLVRSPRGDWFSIATMTWRAQRPSSAWASTRRTLNSLVDRKLVEASAHGLLMKYRATAAGVDEIGHGGIVKVRAPSSRIGALRDLEQAFALAMHAMGCDDDADLRVTTVKQLRCDLHALGVTTDELDAAGLTS